MVESFKKQGIEERSEIDLDLQVLSGQINNEIDSQKEKLVKVVEEKINEKIKIEYKKMVEILAKKLAIETKFIDQELKKKSLGIEERKQLLLEKDNLVNDFYKSVITLARQIEDIVGAKELKT